MTWQHYDLKEKWTHSAALMYGVPTILPTHGIHDRYFEPDVEECSISIWPIGEASGETTPCLLGTGDLYAVCASGKNRDGKFIPYSLKELRREQAGWHPGLSNSHGLGKDPAWFLVGRGASLFYGLMVKPSKVPSTLAGSLEVVRAQIPGHKAHPRSIVGVWLTDTGEQPYVRFDPADPRVAAARSALAECMPKTKGDGFVIVPTDPGWSHSEAGDASPPTTGSPVDPWRARFEEFFGPLEDDGDDLFSGQLRGLIHRLDELPCDLLEAWSGMSSFRFTDQSATVMHWQHGDIQLASLDIITDDEVFDRAVACVGGDGEQAYVLVLWDYSLRDLTALLGIPKDLQPREYEATLGFG